MTRSLTHLGIAWHPPIKVEPEIWKLDETNIASVVAPLAMFPVDARNELAHQMCIAIETNAAPVEASGTFFAIFIDTPHGYFKQEFGLFVRSKREEGLLPRAPSSKSEVIGSRQSEALAKVELIWQRDAAGDVRRAGDMIFDYIDRLLSDGSQESRNLCNFILERIDVERYSSFSLRSFLNITFAAKEMLPTRRMFFVKAKDVIVKAKGLEKAERILAGLE
jgi:hypothetical protein